MPLQSQQERFYAFVEDIGLIWLDFIRQYYRAGRMIPIEQDGQRLYVPLPESVLDNYTMRLKVDVGPSSMWSEVQVIKTLDNLLSAGQISLRQYLERMPDGHIPMKEELLSEMRQAEIMIQAAQPNAGSGLLSPPDRTACESEALIKEASALDHAQKKQTQKSGGKRHGRI